MEATAASFASGYGDSVRLQSSWAPVSSGRWRARRSAALRIDQGHQEMRKSKGKRMETTESSGVCLPRRKRGRTAAVTSGRGHSRRSRSPWYTWGRLGVAHRNGEDRGTNGRERGGRSSPESSSTRRRTCGNGGQTLEHPGGSQRGILGAIGIGRRGLFVGRNGAQIGALKHPES